MKRRSISVAGVMMTVVALAAQNADVSMTVKDNVTTMSNGIVAVTI